MFCEHALIGRQSPKQSERINGNLTYTAIHRTEGFEK